MSLLVSPEFIILIMAPHELPRTNARVSMRVEGCGTTNRLSLQRGETVGYIHSKFKDAARCTQFRAIRIIISLRSGNYFK